MIHVTFVCYLEMSLPFRVMVFRSIFMERRVAVVGFDVLLILHFKACLGWGNLFLLREEIRMTLVLLATIAMLWFPIGWFYLGHVKGVPVVLLPVLLE